MISIFAKHTYLLDSPLKDGKYLQRVSSRIRGEEIAEYLGAKFNPKKGYENDVRIFVKACGVRHIKDGDYVDVLDDVWMVKWLKEHPGVKVIAMSISHYKFLKKELKNKIVLIPHHHINFERILRDRKEIINCGYVGANSTFHQKMNRKIKAALEKIGFNFTPLLNFQTRQEIIDYYKTIDIQIIGYFDYIKDSPYYHPTKIINAMSFGIPTIAGPKLGYKDVDDFYIHVNNMDELVGEALRMKDPKQYNEWPAKIIKEAEKYHISNIAKLYQALT